MPATTEAPLEPNMLATIQACAGEGITFLDLDPAAAEAKPVVEAIDAYVYQWQKGHRQLPEKVDADDVPYTLGSLWGEQLVARFGWEWVMVTLHEQADARLPAVVSPDRALAVYPIHFLADCMQDPSRDGTIALSFNMLEAGSIKDLEPGQYLDLMQGVQRIVPRE